MAAMTEAEEFWAVLRAEAREREQSRAAALERAYERMREAGITEPRRLSTEHLAIVSLANDGRWLIELAEAIYQLLMFGPDRDSAQTRAVELMGEFDRQAAEWYENGYRAACRLGLAPILASEEFTGGE